MKFFVIVISFLGSISLLAAQDVVDLSSLRLVAKYTVGKMVDEIEYLYNPHVSMNQNVPILTYDQFTRTLEVVTSKNSWVINKDYYTISKSKTVRRLAWRNLNRISVFHKQLTIVNPNGSLRFRDNSLTDSDDYSFAYFPFVDTLIVRFGSIFDTYSNAIGDGDVQVNKDINQKTIKTLFLFQKTPIGIRDDILTYRGFFISSSLSDFRKIVSQLSESRLGQFPGQSSGGNDDTDFGNSFAFQIMDSSGNYYWLSKGSRVVIYNRNGVLLRDFYIRGLVSYDGDGYYSSMTITPSGDIFVLKVKYDGKSPVELYKLDFPWTSSSSSSGIYQATSPSFMIQTMCNTFVYPFGEWIPADITATTVLRQDPKSDSASLKNLPVSTPVTILVTKIINGTTWYKVIDWHSVQGWVKASDLKVEDRYVCTDDNVNVRARPTTDSAVLTQVFSYVQVTVLGHTDTPETIEGQTSVWYHVKTDDGHEGWMFGAFLKPVER